MHDLFFAFTNGENEQSRPLVVCGLVVQRPSAPAALYQPPCKKHSIGLLVRARHRTTSVPTTHSLIPEPTSIDWERISGKGLETMKQLSDPAKIQLVTHLEDSTRIQQAYLGIRFLHAPKEL